MGCIRRSLLHHWIQCPSYNELIATPVIPFSKARGAAAKEYVQVLSGPSLTFPEQDVPNGHFRANSISADSISPNGISRNGFPSRAPPIHLES